MSCAGQEPWHFDSSGQLGEESHRVPTQIAYRVEMVAVWIDCETSGAKLAE